MVETMGNRKEGEQKIDLKAPENGPFFSGPEELKKYCRVCGLRVPRFYKGIGGRRCVACLHRTHPDHLAGNRRVCLRCQWEELYIPAGRRLPPSVSLVHLADLHIGAGSPWRAELIKNWISGGGWDYVLVSGDLTGRAGSEEYQKAGRWIGDIESAGAMVAVVPGNHDIGYWGSAASVAGQAAGRKYRRWINRIGRPIEPCLRGPGCLLLGLNSAHGISPSRLFNGYLDRHQRARAVEVILATPPDYLKVVFCHHPLVRFGDNRHRAMFGARRTREELQSAGADLFLWGHQHSFAAVELGRPGGKKSYAVQGPTLSDRVRKGEFPGFTAVEWIFNRRVIVRSYKLVDDRSIEEGAVVEYSLGGTAAAAVE